MSSAVPASGTGTNMNRAKLPPDVEARLHLMGSECPLLAVLGGDGASGVAVSDLVPFLPLQQLLWLLPQLHLHPKIYKLKSTERTSAEVDEYMTSKLCPPGQWAADPALPRCNQRALEAGIPSIEVSPLQGQWLAVTAKGIRAERILEIGTLWG
jgi:hypothetical protein